MFVPDNLIKANVNEHFSLLGAFVGYEEYKVFWKWPEGLYLHHFNFFLTYESVQEARVFVPDNLIQPNVI